MSITDEALERVNCYGIGAWLEATLLSVGFTFPPISLKSDAVYVTPRASGLVFTLSRVSTPTQDPRDQFVCAVVEGDAAAHMPLGLDAAIETPASAARKLSTSVAGGKPSDLARGDRRLSFFRDGGRVVELRFGPDLKGFDRILIGRLGERLDWRDPRNR